MAFNDIKIIKGNGGLGFMPPSSDGTSALLFYLKTLPAALIKDGKSSFFGRFSSLAEAEAAGIANVGDTQVVWYHLAEYFRLCGGAILYVLLVKDEGFDGAFHALVNLQRLAQGEARQCGVFAPTQSLTAAHLGNLQARATELEAAHQPLSVVYAPKVVSSELTTLPDLTKLTHPKISVLVGQDGGGLGTSLKNEDSYPTVSCIGACLGAIARRKVSESIAWVAAGNLVSTAYEGQKLAELALPALSDGTLIQDIIPSQLAGLHDKGYLFLIKHIGIGGTYFNDAFTADLKTSDFNSIYANRTLDKVSREIRAALLPTLSAPIKLDDGGNMDAGVVKFWEELCRQPLEAMKLADEISAYNVAIDPAQNVLTDRKLRIALKVVPIGVAKNIEVSLAFALKIS